MLMKISNDLETYQKVAKVLDGGRIVCLPTDTAYTLGVDGTNPDAIKRLYDYVKMNDNLLTFFIPRSSLGDYVIITKKKILDYFLPGPLTVILKKNPTGKLSLDTDKIGVEIPDLDFIINLLDYYKKPIASLNLSHPTEPELNTPQEIKDKLPEIDLIIDNGPLTGKPSTIIDLTTPIPVIKRKGTVSILEIEKIYGRRIKLDPLLKFNLLFVCSGNSCRSPMAKGILKTMINEEFLQIHTAGTAAVDGLPASENTQIVVKEFGGDISDHRTRCLTKELIDDADLILVMEYKHYETVLEFSPASAIKTFLLKEYKRRVKYNEISDPVGKDISVYRDTALEMYPSLKFVAQDIKKRFS